MWELFRPLITFNTIQQVDILVHRPFWKKIASTSAEGSISRFLSVVASRCVIPPLTFKKRFKLLVLWLVNVGFQPLPLKRDWNRCGRMCLRTHDLKHRVRAACHPPNFVNIIKLCMTYCGPHISCMCSPLEWQNPFFNWKINFFLNLFSNRHLFVSYF